MNEERQSYERVYLKKTYLQAHPNFPFFMFKDIKNIRSAHFTIPVPLHNLTDTNLSCIPPPPYLPTEHSPPHLPPLPPPPHSLIYTYYTILTGGRQKVGSYLLIINPRPV